MEAEYFDDEFVLSNEDAMRLSMMAREPDDSGKIKDLLAMGMHCIVRNIEVQCKVTDAFVGVDSLLIAAFHSEAAAAEYLAGLMISDPYADIGVVSPRAAEIAVGSDSGEEAPF